MGGKARLFDPDKMAALYAASAAFDKKANDRLQAIQKQLNRLVYHSGLNLSLDGAGGSRQSVHELDDAAKALRHEFASALRYIQRRLDAASPHTDHSQRDDLGPANTAVKIQPDKKLKK